MKMRSLKRRRQQGNFFLALVVIVAAVILIAVLAYHLLKWINKLLPAKPQGNPQGIAQAAVDQVREELIATYTYPGGSLTIQSIEATVLPAFVPFPDATNGEVIQRTTNWVDWETVAQPFGEIYADTNLFRQAFYRSYGAAVTNAGFTLQKTLK